MRSVGERAFNRPFLVRDRVLRAHSEDGLTWAKDPSLRLTHPSHRRAHMSYYTARDPRGRLWVRASVCDPRTGEWHTELGRPGQSRWWDARSAGLRHLYSPCWTAVGLYGVDVSGGCRRIACFSTDADALPTASLDQSWENIEGFTVVEDVSIVQALGRDHAWVTSGASPEELQIHHWSSVDGLAWAYDGIAVTAPHPGARFDVADNPCVARVDDGWRMYFRTGETPALGNVIRSAHSRDLHTWVHEEGVRIHPGDRWDPHGVGFPNVWREADGAWVMLYAGYWGSVPAADTTVSHWEELGRPA